MRCVCQVDVTHVRAATRGGRPLGRCAVATCCHAVVYLRRVFAAAAMGARERHREVAVSLLLHCDACGLTVAPIVDGPLVDDE